jgi:hypothetical protein
MTLKFAKIQAFNPHVWRRYRRACKIIETGG